MTCRQKKNSGPELKGFLVSNEEFTGELDTCGRRRLRKTRTSTKHKRNVSEYKKRSQHSERSVEQAREMIVKIKGGI